jgi:hypothetical protein
MNATAIIDAVKAVTKKWARQRRAEEREAARASRRRDALVRTRRVTVKDAAWEVIPAAYLKASSGGTLPAQARQVMYAARGPIQERAERMLDDQYFIQTVLTEYLDAHVEETRTWDVVFDARGHFHEPHTNLIVPLGTIDVRQYLADVAKHQVGELRPAVPEAFPTCGPRHRFSAVLFVEKEGFLPLFRRVQLAERFDLAIMSTKGLSVTASRALVDHLCGAHDIPLLILRDFDKSGFSIAATLQRDTPRYKFINRIKVIDLGLRLEDVEKEGLESEDVRYPKSDPRPNLLENGATPDEIQFLCSGGNRWDGFSGRRVELNSFASADLVRWLEKKLRQNCITKVIPDSPTLEMAFRRACQGAVFRERSRKILDDIRIELAQQGVPASLERDVRARLRDEPTLAWDQVVAESAKVTCKNR